jgi:hypothetical protein
MKKILLYLFALILSGCDSQLFSQIQTQTTMKECPQIPKETLIPENVKTISIDGQQVKESGIVQTGRAVGYSFIGKKNQQLSYLTTEGICMWIYSPDNEVITSTTLPQDGKYTAQITTLQGSKTFDIEIGLDVKATSPTTTASPTSSPASVATAPSSTTAKTPSAADLEKLNQEVFANISEAWTSTPVTAVSVYLVKVSQTGEILSYEAKSADATQNLNNTPLPKLVKSDVTQTPYTQFEVTFTPVGTLDLKPFQSTPIPSSYSFSHSNFPQVSCGDSRPNDPNAYPVRFYPVKIPYSEANLSKVRALFCTDALKRSNKKTNIAWIQVASFNDLEQARAFAKFVGTEINGAIVGEPNLLELK